MARLRTSSAATAPAAGARRWWLWVGIALAAAALCALPFVFPVGEWLEQAEGWILARGIWGVALFVGLFVAATLVLAPDWPLAVGAGLVYGLWAVPVVLGAAMVAAALAFLASRHLLRKRVRGWLAHRPRLAAIDRAVGEDGWKIVLLMRLSPLVPFNLQNYVFGATAIPFSHYLAASLAGIAPGAALFVYLGSLGRAARAGRDAGGAVEWIFLGVGLAATIAAILLVARKAKARLAARDIGADQ